MRIDAAKRFTTGTTLIEVLVGIAIFAVGCFTLTQLMLGAATSEAAARRTIVASRLAEERMSEIAAARFEEISEENFPDEDFGRVGGGGNGLDGYRRTVAIVDSVDARARRFMKSVEVEVEWREGGRRRNVSLRSNLSGGETTEP